MSDVSQNTAGSFLTTSCALTSVDSSRDINTSYTILLCAGKKKEVIYGKQTIDEE
jgi:hypothetical protein